MKRKRECPANIDDIQCVDIQAVAKIFDLNPKTIEELESSQQLPPSFKVRGARRWLLCEIRKTVQQLREGSLVFK